MTGDVLPPTGFIEVGVAAGFIILTDSGIGMLEGYVSNHKAPSEERHQAFLSVTNRLLEVAKEKGLRTVIALSRDPSITCRATTLHGFDDIGLYCLLNKGV